MNQKPTVSISIVTRNRLFELERCLKSILNQSILPDEVIVIDNDPKKSAKSIIQKKAFSPLRIKYFTSSGSVPKCRNIAIKKATSNYLGFIDDDCVIHRHWVKVTKKTTRDLQPNVVIGKTHLLNQKNLWALAQHSRDAYWKKYNHQLFDTKNAVVNLREIRKAKLAFDEDCQYQWYDSADFDFDFQLKKQGWQRTYSPWMIVLHQETSEFDRFRKRAFGRGYLARYLDRKWNLGDTLVDRSTKLYAIWLLKMVKNFLIDWRWYEREMPNENILNKAIAVVIIKLFERYYIQGYEANT